MITPPERPSAKFGAARVRVVRETTDPWRGLTSRPNPSIDPPRVTAQMEALADVFDEGGRELIAEVEHGLSPGGMGKWPHVHDDVFKFIDYAELERRVLSLADAITNREIPVFVDIGERRFTKTKK